MRFPNGSTLVELARAPEPPGVSGLTEVIRQLVHPGPLWGKTFDD
jgi:hypothetical protein